MNPLLDALFESFQRAWKEVRAEASVDDLLPLLRPVPPFDGPGAMAPVTTLATLLGLTVLSGIAVTAFGVLLVALLGLWLLLTRVLGISVEVRPFAA